MKKTKINNNVIGLQQNDNTIEYDNLLFCFSIVFPSVVTLFTQSLRLFVRTRSLDTLFVYGLMALVIFKAFPIIRRCITKKDLILCFTLSLAFLLSALNPIADITLINNVCFELLRSSLFVYIGAKIVHESPKLNMYLRVSSCVLLIRVLATIYIFNTSTISKLGYSQADGYYLLTGMALLILPLVSEHRPFDLIMAVTIFITTLLTGARGPFLVSALMVVTSVFIMNVGDRRNLLNYIIPIALIIIVYRNMKEILIYISSFVDNATSLRTITRLLNNEFFNDSVRMRQYEIAWNYIKEHIFCGCGVVNDRVIQYRAMPSLGIVEGSYPHNFFLEIAMQFGLIMGSILSLIMIISVISTYRNTESLRERLLFSSLVLVGFVPLMFSGSYLSYTMFFALLGFCNRRPGTFNNIRQSDSSGVFKET